MTRWPAAVAEAFTGPAGRATSVLIALRVAYAYNWLDVGPALPGIGSTFQIGPADWGVLLAAFLVGAGIFQVPAGLLARRWGARRVAFLGVLLLGGAGVAAAAAPSFGALLAVRAIAGAGAALFFPPAIGLVARIQPTGRRGIAVGVFSSAFAAGAAIGVFVSAVVIPYVSWRGALFIGGALLLAVLAVGAAFIPEPPPESSTNIPGRRIAALRSRGVWAIGLAFIGLEGASLSASQYYVPFAETVRGWAPALAGGIASLFVFPSFFGGPLGGALTERFTNRRTQMVLATALSGGLLVGVPFAGLGVVIPLAIVFAVSYGAVYAMMYVLAPYLPGIPAEEVPLSIGLFNAIQISGGALVAYLFALIVAVSSYEAAWLVLAIVTVVPLVLLAAVPVTGTTAFPSSRAPLPPA